MIKLKGIEQRHYALLERLFNAPTLGEADRAAAERITDWMEDQWLVDIEAAARCYEMSFIKRTSPLRKERGVRTYASLTAAGRTYVNAWAQGRIEGYRVEAVR